MLHERRPADPETVCRYPLRMKLRLASLPVPFVLPVVLGAAAPASAAGDAPVAAAEAAPSPVPVSPDSPRAALQAWLDLCRAGRHDLAARYLQVPDGDAVEGPVLARRLKAVVDRHLWFDLDRVSPFPEGDVTDGLPYGVDEVGAIPGPTGSPEPLRMTRASRHGEGPAWVFASTSVERIDDWYGALPDRWALDYIPEPLLRPGPRELLWWQWIALPVLVVLAGSLGALLARLSRGALFLLTRRTVARWDDLLVQRTGAPLALVWAVLLLHASIPGLGLYAPAEAFLRSLLHGAVLVALFWALMRSVDIGQEILRATPWAQAQPSSRALIPLGGRVVKIAVLAIALVAVLSQLGYPVASLLAGLGIGGLAVALAAQKTFENLFGAFALGVDQPMREGDFVKIDDFVGTVENIGLRSTRVRTLDRTVISIPNGRLAEKRIETFAARDRIRLACTIALVYGTTAAQMRSILAGFEQVLRAHPRIWPNDVVVKLKELGASSLDVEVTAWFCTSDWGEFRGFRQEVLLAFMDVVEQSGSSFAFPTRTIHLTGAAATVLAAPSARAGQER